jgi:hypothetical protein
MAKTVFDVLDEKIADIQREQEEFVNSGGAKQWRSKRLCWVQRSVRGDSRSSHRSQRDSRPFA